MQRTRHHFLGKSGVRLFLLIAAALSIIVITGSGYQSREPLSSSETRFVEFSAGGMQIVPASCPSSPPHFTGDTGLPNCTTPVSRPTLPQCPADSTSTDSTQTFTVNDTFTVPANYHAILVECWGGGAGGSGDGSSGGGGSPSIFSSMAAGGGLPTSGGTASGGDVQAPGSPGAGPTEAFGAVLGGTGGTAGGPGGGTGGTVPGTLTAPGTSGNIPGGGGSGYTANRNGGIGGGGGGYVAKVFAAGTLSSGTSMPVTVGAGGSGGAGSLQGGSGARGECRIVVRRCAPPPAPPSAPVLSSGSCTLGEPVTITMTSSDPDGDRIRYALDWDLNGVTDHYVPPTGYVDSGTSQTATQVYSTAGTKTVKVRAEDETDRVSEWATLAFECSAPVILPSCSITADDTSIEEGGSTMLRWISENNTWMYINSIGYVPATGSVLVAPAQTTSYNGSAGNITSEVQCPFTLTVVPPGQDPQEPQCPAGHDCIPPDGDTCPAGYTLQGTSCVSSTPLCPTGQSWNGTECVTNPLCPAGHECLPPNATGSCPSGYTRDGDLCVSIDISCPSGTTWNGTECVSTGACPIGYERQGATCTFVSCPLGYTLQGTTCEYTGCPTGYTRNPTTLMCDFGQCVSQPICGSGLLRDHVVDSCSTTSSIENCTERGPDYFCSGGQCVYIPVEPDAETGSIKVRPSRVRSGNTTEVSWSTQNFSSCTVSEDNPGITDSWSGLTGTEQSSAITRRTIYTLRCDGQVVDTATVNVVTRFIEK